MSPEEAGLPPAELADLKGGSGKQNAHVLRAMLDGEHGPFRDIVLFTAAAALVVADKAGDLKEGVELAADAVDSGRARRSLERLIAISHEKVPG